LIFRVIVKIKVISFTPMAGARGFGFSTGPSLPSRAWPWLTVGFFA